MRKETATVFAILLLLTTAFAVDQMKFLVTPSSGTFTFSRQGGILEFAVSNYGDLSGNVEIEVSGEGAEFIKSPKDIFSRPNEVKKFRIEIVPTTRVEYEKPYYVEVTFSPRLSDLTGEQVSGVSVIPSVSIPLNIIFEKKGNAPTLYQSVSVPSGGATIAKDNSLLILLLLLIIAIIGGLFVYFKSKRKKNEDEWEEEVVIRRRKRI